ncbi:MAG TPA: hypothetical protein VFI61_00925, partial [Patescibacteria group bacterium]|nr:hypothetical protein [Patescibacteria group bacterium]
MSKKWFTQAIVVFLIATAFSQPQKVVLQEGACPDAQAQLKPTDIAVVTVPDGQTLKLRERPGINKKEILKIQPYTYVTIIAGPICDGGYRWFEVGLNGQDGWSAEVGPEGEYYMIPNGQPVPTQKAGSNPPENINPSVPQHDCENCIVDPCVVNEVVIVDDKMYIPYGQLRRIPNLETLDAMEIPRCAVHEFDPNVWGNEWPPSNWELGEDIPDVKTNPYEFCVFYWSDWKTSDKSLTELCGNLQQ